MRNIILVFIEVPTGSGFGIFVIAILALAIFILLGSNLLSWIFSAIPFTQGLFYAKPYGWIVLGLIVIVSIYNLCKSVKTKKVRSNIVQAFTISTVATILIVVFILIDDCIIHGKAFQFWNTVIMLSFGNLLICFVIYPILSLINAIICIPFSFACSQCWHYFLNFICLVGLCVAGESVLSIIYNKWGWTLFDSSYASLYSGVVQSIVDGINSYVPESGLTVDYEAYEATFNRLYYSMEDIVRLLIGVVMVVITTVIDSRIVKERD